MREAQVEWLGLSFRRELMSTLVTAILLEFPSTQEALICKPSIGKMEGFGKFRSWHDIYQFGTFKLWQILP